MKKVKGNDELECATVLFLFIGVLTLVTGTDELHNITYEKCHPCIRNRYCEFAGILYFVQYLVGKIMKNVGRLSHIDYF